MDKFAPATLRGAGVNAKTKGEPAMQRESRSRRIEAVRAHPLAELLECPPATGLLFSGSAQSLHFVAGQAVFRQSDLCRGLYLVVSGRFLRQTEWQHARLPLSPARSGELLELAAALGDGRHNYTLAAQTAGSVLMLPMEALQQAFQRFPPLRMRLLEELAREVSRAYYNCCSCRLAALRRTSSAA
jgi:CRP-like cAMP-binding protein